MSFAANGRVVFSVLPALLAILLEASPLEAGFEMSRSVRLCTTEATDILLVEPANASGPQPQWRVKEVIAGGRYETGEAIAVRCATGVSLPTERGGNSPAAGRIDQALLFIQPPADWERWEEPQPPRADIRAVNGTGDVLESARSFTPGFDCLTSRKGLSWDKLLADVRTHATELARVRALRTIADPSERNQELFRWIDAHLHEFAPVMIDPGAGWGRLQYDVIGWIMESCIAEDCWRAFALYYELRQKDLYRGATMNTDFTPPSYCTPAGRKLLLERIDDASIPEDLRLFALCELSLRRTHFKPDGVREPDYLNTIDTSADERDALLRRIVQLLDDQRPEWRTKAADCIGRIATRDYQPHGGRPQAGRALERLRRLFFEESDPSVFSAVANAVNLMENGLPAYVWESKGHRVCVLVRYLGVSDGQVRLELMYRSTAPIDEATHFELGRTLNEARSHKLVIPIEYPAGLKAVPRTSEGRLVAVPRVKWRSELWNLRAVGRGLPSGGGEWESADARFFVPGTLEADD